MASGGARVRSGPPPDPNALRRDRKSDGEWTILPAEGRAGDPPTWPLRGQSEREAELWSALWAKPQAVQWEQLGQEIEVALYVRNLAQFELPGAPVNLGTLVRQQADALGLTIPGLRSHRWKIAAGQAGVNRDETAPKATMARASARDRFRVIDGSAEG